MSLRQVLEGTNEARIICILFVLLRFYDDSIHTRHILLGVHILCGEDRPAHHPPIHLIDVIGPLNHNLPLLSDQNRQPSSNEQK